MPVPPMTIETQFAKVTITNPPEAERLTQIIVNLQDGTVELTYKGFEQRPYIERAVYSGELDQPGRPPLIEGYRGPDTTTPVIGGS